MNPPKHGNVVFFPRKLKGAHARLFAAACLHYIEAAIMQCNDTNSGLPVWCGISPYQRLHLVKEVMIGLLCDEEPIPQTAQHFVAYMGIWKTIEVQLDVEMDLARDTDTEMVHAIIDSCPPDPENLTKNVEKETKAEKDERLKYAVRAKIASRTKKKLIKKMEKQTSVGIDIMNEEDALSKKSSPSHKIMDNRNPLDVYSEFVIDRNKFIFDGGPPPQESRTFLRPKPSDDMTYWVFQWRILCDDAFQEHTDPFLLCPLPLCYLNFNWKYSPIFDKSRIDDKWHQALHMLTIESGFINYSAVSDDILPLHLGVIDDAEYANPKNHRRIIDGMNTIKEWRGEYDESWDSTKQSLDQRCIFAVCSTELFGDKSQRRWQCRFLTRCQDEKINFLQPGNYQARLDIHRSLEDFDPDGLKSLFMNAFYSDLCHPIKYQSEESFSRYDTCHGHMCYSPNKLSKCARCKVIKYCSRDCQVKDWPIHKKDCKALATLINDKKLLAKLCRES